MYPAPNCRISIYSLPQKPQISPSGRPKIVESDVGSLPIPNLHRNLFNPKLDGHHLTQVQTSAEVHTIHFQDGCSVGGSKSYLSRRNSHQTDPYFNRISQSTQKSGSRLRTQSPSRRTKFLLKKRTLDLKVFVGCNPPRSNSCFAKVETIDMKKEPIEDKNGKEPSQSSEENSDAMVTSMELDIESPALQANQVSKVDLGSQMLIGSIKQLNSHTWAMIPIMEEFAECKTNLRLVESPNKLDNQEQNDSSRNLRRAAKSLQKNFSLFIDDADPVLETLGDHEDGPQTPKFSKRSRFSFGSISEHRQPILSERT